MCQVGARVVQKKVLDKIQDDRLSVFVVWLPRFPGDGREVAEKARSIVPDRRARHFWDGAGSLGRSFGKIVDLPEDRDFAWDVYFVFDPEAKWGDGPPVPDFWMHQLGMETQNRLDGKQLQEAVRQRLPKS